MYVLTLEKTSDILDNVDHQTEFNETEDEVESEDGTDGRRKEDKGQIERTNRERYEDDTHARGPEI